MTAKRYKPGEPFASAVSTLVHISEGGHVYYRHKYMHHGFIEHWSIAQIVNAIRYGHLRMVADSTKTIKENT